MKFTKFSVLAKIICTSAASSYIAYSFFTIKQEEMARKSCAHDCRPDIQKLKINCSTEKNFIITGNWKMNGDKKLAEEMIKLLRCGPIAHGNDVIIAIPSPYLDFFQQRKPKYVEVAAQNIYKENNGAYTGEISADMLLDIGVKWVILGASERRLYFHEDYELIGEKAAFALSKDLKVVIGIGETASEREKNEHIQAVLEQLQTLLKHIPKNRWRHLVFAYEPLWTVGTGKSITPEEGEEMARAIRDWAAKNVDEHAAEGMRIQIGGPLSPAAAKAFVKKKEIDGFYVGSASLKPDFIAMVNVNKKLG